VWIAPKRDDYLLWDAFDFSSREPHIENTEFHQLKSEDSAGVVGLDDNLTAIFRGYCAGAKSEFVIESNGSVKRKAGSGSYRCEPHRKAVIAWLREQGVEAQKPVHELRKEIGSLVASEHGIYAASRYLRHSDIRITPALSSSLTNPTKVVGFGEAKEDASTKTA